MFDFNITDIISCACAVISLIVATIIAVVQYKQDKQMKALAMRQDAEEKRHREQQVRAQRDSFIIKYNDESDEIYLLPLCWISSFYDSSLHYYRKMYREYNMLEEDVQLAICEHMNFKLTKPEYSGNQFYNLCVNKLCKEAKKYLREPYGDPLFYDNAKYLRYCIEYNKGEKVSQNYNKLENLITDLLRDYKFENNKCPYPLEEFVRKANFSSTSFSEANEICAIAAKWVAEWDKQDVEGVWIPSTYGYETIETKEDLFLCSLFCIYIYLVLPNK